MRRELDERADIFPSRRRIQRLGERGRSSQLEGHWVKLAFCARLQLSLQGGALQPLRDGVALGRVCGPLLRERRHGERSA